MHRLATLTILGLLGCSAAKNNELDGTTSTAETSTGVGGEGAASTASASTAGVGGFDPQTGSGGGGEEVPLEAEVFGHSATTLYRLDPTTKQVAIVGPFQQCSSVIDIAIDADNNLFGTTFDGLYRIDKKTAVCTFIASGSYPNSLSFVPAGTLLPNDEALVGYLGAQYVRIDTTTGAITKLGNLGGGYQSSGDIVSVKGGGTYLTVNGSDCLDCLVEVNPKTGALTKNWGAVGYGAVFGLAYWAGRAYGFNQDGYLFEIQFQPNSVTSTLIGIPNAPPSLSFWGAGSTTIAPVDEPK